MDKRSLIQHLNEDLAGEFGAIIQYLTYAAKATGPYRPQLAQFFLAEVADEQMHAQFLANNNGAQGAALSVALSAVVLLLLAGAGRWIGVQQVFTGGRS